VLSSILLCIISTLSFDDIANANMSFFNSSIPVVTPTNNELISLPPEWVEHDTQMIIAVCGEEDLLSATSFQGASKVLEQWLSDESHRCYNQEIQQVPCNSRNSLISSSFSISAETDPDIASLMEVDEQIGNDLLGDDVFGRGLVFGRGGDDNCCEHIHYGCDSPTGPIEELRSLSTMNMINDDDRCFLIPLLDDSMDFVGATEQQQQQQPSLVIDQKIFKKLEESMKRSQKTRNSLLMKTSRTEGYSRTKSITKIISSIESSSCQLNTYLQTIQRTI